MDNPRSVPQAQKLRDALEEDIVNGALRPGDRLDEAALAERFEVSRTPLREAFKALAGSGLVGQNSVTIRRRCIPKRQRERLHHPRTGNDK